MNIPKPGGDPASDIINLSTDHMVDHPAGAHMSCGMGPPSLTSACLRAGSSALRSPT
jgi:hypothetical protein